MLEEIWDASGEFVNDNTLTVYIKRLRKRLKMMLRNPEIIKRSEEWGIGAYEFFRNGEIKNIHLSIWQS